MQWKPFGSTRQECDAKKVKRFGPLAHWKGRKPVWGVRSLRVRGKHEGLDSGAMISQRGAIGGHPLVMPRGEDAVAGRWGRGDWMEGIAQSGGSLQVGQCIHGLGGSCQPRRSSRRFVDGLVNSKEQRGEGRSVTGVLAARVSNLRRPDPFFTALGTSPNSERPQGPASCPGGGDPVGWRSRAMARRLGRATTKIFHSPYHLGPNEPVTAMGRCACVRAVEASKRLLSRPDHSKNGRLEISNPFQK